MEIALVIVAVVVAWALAVAVIIRFMMGAKRLRAAEDAMAARAAEEAENSTAENLLRRVPDAHVAGGNLSSKHERRLGTNPVSSESQPAELAGQTSINDLLIEAGEEPIHPIVVAAPTDAQIHAFMADGDGTGHGRQQ
ncbi:hypothetical protein IV498_16240 [Paenarthrobacter sp. Z7-10]|uniref:hypothetical protein n=1 Tax=Paenarthrobacter sp. Z7-10 TaxID=2787635 RepID=UPI0022A9CED1|nr:hypothetical protein [Paenarthrobacter sp. Z7-10]MCZ2404685.1 hypothetical protein [Paenarthrobacter sp. Z7-10]